MPLLRLVFFAAPWIVAWFVNPIGLPMSIAKIGAGEANVLDWIKVAVVLVLSIVFSLIPGKKHQD